MEALRKIQEELKAPKNQRNNFGKYDYRSAEDILEAVKPLLHKYDCTMTMSDEIKEVSGIPFVEATVLIQLGSGTVMSPGESKIVTASAGVQLETKGMNYAQCFGASSSYARKYALNGMFLIDDNKDQDVTNTHEATTPVQKKIREKLEKGSKRWDNVVKRLKAGSASMRNIEDAFEVSVSDLKELVTIKVEK